MYTASNRNVGILISRIERFLTHLCEYLFVDLPCAITIEAFFVACACLDHVIYGISYFLSLFTGARHVKLFKDVPDCSFMRGSSFAIPFVHKVGE